MLDRDCVTRDTDGLYYRKTVKKGIEYCISEVEQHHTIRFNQSPYNRTKDVSSVTFIQDLRQAEILKGCLIVTNDCDDVA